MTPSDIVPDFGGPDFEWLVGLFGPVIIRVFMRELDDFLEKGVAPERIDEWIGLVGGYDVGFIKKRIILHLLKKKRRQAAEKGSISLSMKERAVILEKVERHLPAKIVETWLSAIRELARRSGNRISLASFDSAMMPTGARLTLHKEYYDAFGVTASQLRSALALVRHAAGDRVPVEALHFLRRNGVTFVD